MTKSTLAQPDAPPKRDWMDAGLALDTSREHDKANLQFSKMKLQIIQEFDKSWTFKQDGEPVVSHKSFKECDEARDRVRGLREERESMTFSRDELLILDDAVETTLMVYQNNLDEFSSELSKKDLSLVRSRVIELQELRKRLADERHP